jgi:hypothetical protein
VDPYLIAARHIADIPSRDVIAAITEGDRSPLGPGDLWHTKGAKLPGYVREVAHSLIKDGRPKSDAIRIAIGVIRNWAEGKGNVTAKTRAKAAAAVAEYEATRAKAHATP